MKIQLIIIHLAIILSFSFSTHVSADMKHSVRHKKQTSSQPERPIELTPIIETKLNGELSNQNPTWEKWANGNEDKIILIKSQENSLLGLN